MLIYLTIYTLINVLIMRCLASLSYLLLTLYLCWSSGVVAKGSATVTKISWTLSKPPANLFKWETTQADPEYTLTSLSSGNYVLQAIAQDEDGTSTHSGVITGTISDEPETITVVLNPLIQADATRFQQPSYIKWIKTNSTTVYPGDAVELTIKGSSNPPDSDMQFTIDNIVKCTSKDECVIDHIIPEQATDPYDIQLGILGMGYSIPMEFMVKDFVPVEFRAVFNVPPVITHINSAHSLLHQIGTSTTVTATFDDPENADVTYTWTIEALQGQCPITELAGDLTDTVASGSSVSVVYTPTTLGAKCIVKIRCEDAQGAVSLGEVYIYVDTVPVYFPPYVVSKLQSKQVAAVGDSVDFSLEMCEPQDQMITVSWTTDCGSLDHTSDTITASPDCHWIYNDILLSSVPCNIAWTATDSDGSPSSGKFRILANNARRLKETGVPRVRVITKGKRLTTVMDWPEPEKKDETMEQQIIKKGVSSEGVALIVLASLLLVGLIAIGILMKMRKVECVIPESKPITKPQTPTSPRSLEMGRKRIESLKFAVRKQSPHIPDPPAVKEDDEKVEITPQMLGLGARRQMRMKRHEKQKRHESIGKLKNDLLPSGGHDMHLDHPAHAKTMDGGWENRIKSHRTINRHPGRDTKRFNGNPSFGQKTKN